MKRIFIAFILLFVCSSTAVVAETEKGFLDEKLKNGYINEYYAVLCSVLTTSQIECTYNYLLKQSFIKMATSRNPKIKTSILASMKAGIDVQYTRDFNYYKNRLFCEQHARIVHHETMLKRCSIK